MRNYWKMCKLEKSGVERERLNALKNLAIKVNCFHFEFPHSSSLCMYSSSPYSIVVGSPRNRQKIHHWIMKNSSHLRIPMDNLKSNFLSSINAHWNFFQSNQSMASLSQWHLHSSLRDLREGWNRSSTYCWNKGSAAEIHVDADFSLYGKCWYSGFSGELQDILCFSGWSEHARKMFPTRQKWYVAINVDMSRHVDVFIL